MSRERGYFLSFPEGEKADTKAFLESRLSDPRIRKWAYIKQDKEVYTESDIRAKRFGLQYNWADGFEGMEKYSSCKEYVEEYMNKPPFAGDKKKEIWRLVCILERSAAQMISLRSFLSMNLSSAYLPAERRSPAAFGL